MLTLDDERLQPSRKYDIKKDFFLFTEVIYPLGIVDNINTILCMFIVYICNENTMFITTIDIITNIIMMVRPR